MKYRRFEELPVWKEAIELAVTSDALADERVFTSKRRYKDQLEGAALSVSNNIAEGFERGTTNELLMFLYIARGSAGEVRSMMCFLERVPWCSDFKSQISNLKSRAESISRQLRAWAATLQESDIQGQRRLTSQSKRHFEHAKIVEEMDREIQESVERSAHERSTHR
jgi:four helix bundle protein